MQLRFIVPTVVLAGLPFQSLADGHQEDARALFEAIGLPETIETLSLEGLAYGDRIASELFPGPPPAEWAARVADIYATERLEAALFEGFAAQLKGEDIAAMTAFFTSEPGQTLIALEVSAREARLDEQVERASIESAALAAADQEPRFMRIADYVAEADLVESNVVAAMNFNYAFYLGLVEGGALGAMSEDDILSDVWAQEPEIRSDTREWIFSFLYMAYQPVTDADLETYIAYNISDDGLALNQALIAAFDPVYVDLSRAMGRAAAEMMTQHEL